MLPVPGVHLLIVPKTFLHFCFRSLPEITVFFVVKTLMVSYQMAGTMQNSLHQCESFAMMTDSRVSLWITQKVIYHILLASLLRDFAQAYSTDNHDCMTSAELVTITTARCSFHHLWNTLPTMRCCPSQNFGRYSKAVEYLYSWEY